MLHKHKIKIGAKLKIAHRVPENQLPAQYKGRKGDDAIVGVGVGIVRSIHKNGFVLNADGQGNAPDNPVINFEDVVEVQRLKNSTYRKLIRDGVLPKNIKPL